MVVFPGCCYLRCFVLLQKVGFMLIQQGNVPSLYVAPEDREVALIQHLVISDLCNTSLPHGLNQSFA